MVILWNYPSPSNSHHHDYFFFSRESWTKPSFVAGILGAGQTEVMLIFTEYTQLSVSISLCWVLSRFHCLISNIWRSIGFNVELWRNLDLKSKMGERRCFPIWLEQWWKPMSSVRFRNPQQYVRHHGGVKEVPVQLKKTCDVLLAHPWHTRNFASYFLVNRSGVVQHLPGGRNSPSTMKATVEAA